MLKRGKKVDSRKRISDSPSQASLHYLIVATPLIIAAVFSLAFMQFFSDESKPVLTSNEDSSSQTIPIETLPIVTQPTLPNLEQSIEVIAPPLPDSNPESRYQNPGNDQKGIGPSSKDALKALQGVHNSQGGNSNNPLQGTSQRIKLEDAKL